MHVLWGWMQVDDVIPVGNCSLASWMAYHPHLAGFRGPNNTLYVASETLALDGAWLDLPGAGVFSHYDDRLRLTKPGHKRSMWELPAWFAPRGSRPALGYHSDPGRWELDGERVTLHSAARGQEFVLDTRLYPEALEWLGGLLQAGG